MPTTCATRITIQEERFASAWPDAADLLRQHWQEIAAYPDIPLDVDEGVYHAMDAADRLCVVTARLEDGTLVGYAVFFLNQHPHYRSSRQATQDVLYLRPDQRHGRTGLRLIQAAEAALRARGCQLVHHHVKPAHPALGRLLEHGGYHVGEVIYSKRLDQES